MFKHAPSGFCEDPFKVGCGDPKPPIPNTLQLPAGPKIGPNPGLDLFKHVPSGCCEDPFKVGCGDPQPPRPTFYSHCDLAEPIRLPVVNA